VAHVCPPPAYPPVLPAPPRPERAKPQAIAEHAGLAIWLWQSNMLFEDWVGRLTSIPPAPAREAGGALGRLAALDDSEPQGDGQGLLGPDRAPGEDEVPVGPSTAFFTSGRLMTTVRTLPSRWTFTVGCSAISSIFRRPHWGTMPAGRPPSGIDAGR